MLPELLDLQERQCSAMVRGWLSRTGAVAVLSMTSYGPGGHNSLPDAALDAVAVDVDLQAAMARLPALHRVACALSRHADRSERGWFGRLAVRLVSSRVGPLWLAWQDEQEELHGQGCKPFELLLDDAAGRITRDLGRAWWPEPRIGGATPPPPPTA